MMRNEAALEEGAQHAARLQAKPEEVRILVTGGGTGGHVSPALAVIQAIREMVEGASWQPVFRYIGSESGVEKRLALEAGLDFVGVASGKLRRSRRLSGLLTRANLKDMFQVPRGIVQALREVRRFRPDVVFATGGYVSVPPVVAAALLRVPILIHEQTVQVGLANQITARLATRMALTFEGAAAELPPGIRRKTFVTGNPVREVIFQGDKARAVTRFRFAPEDNGLPTVYVTGGAQGAHQINVAVEAALPELLAGCRIIHQCGQGADYESLHAAAQALPAELKRRYYLACFVGGEIGDAFALADLVVGRSGAGTVAEVSALGKPALFVPLVPTGGDEQNRNAKRSAEAGAALILPGNELSGERLLEEVQALLDDPERRALMSKAASALARPQAARDLAEAVLALAR